MSKHDVVIAGAGPAGIQCARDLAKRDYDVLVLETESEDEYPRTSNKSTGGTFASMLGAFSIPDEVVMHFTEKIILESPNDFFSLTHPGAVLDFGAFKRFLVEDGQDAGAEYWFDARVSKPITDDGTVVGVRYNGDEEVYADIVVDATGPAAPLAKDLGVIDLERSNQAIGLEWEMESIDHDHDGYADTTDAMMLRLDNDLSSGGYSWIFHTGDDTAKVGLCYIQDDSYHTSTDEMTIDDSLQQWVDADPRFTDAERLAGEQHRGSAHIQQPDKLCADGFMAIGDTIPTVDPLWGEGIHIGMKSARAAAITADRCLMGATDTSAAEMSIYADLWHRNVSPNANVRLLMTRLLYLASDDRYDQFMKDMSQFDIDTLSNANAGSPLAIAKLLHRDDLPLLWDFFHENHTLITQMLSNTIPLHN